MKLDIGKPLACRERRRRRPPSWNFWWRHFSNLGGGRTSWEPSTTYPENFVKIRPMVAFLQRQLYSWCTATRQCIEYRRAAAVLLSMQSQWWDNARIFSDFSENVRFSGIFFSATAEDFSKILEQDCSLDIQSIRYYFWFRKKCPVFEQKAI